MIQRIANLSSSVLFALVESPLFIALARFFSRCFKPKKDICVQLRGHHMYANTLDRLVALFLWKYSSLEDFETQLIQRTVKEGMTVMDIGANIGYHTLQLARLVGPTGKVLAFEPEKQNYALLKKNIKANGYTNIVCYPKAVSDKTARAKLFLREEHRGDHRIFDSGDGRDCVEIETVRLDTLLAETPVDFIKIDVQGAEALVFDGMASWLAQQGEIVIITEFSPYLLEKCGCSGQSFLDRIQALGFDLQWINEKTKRLESASPQELIAMCHGQRYVNLYLKKGESGS